MWELLHEIVNTIFYEDLLHAMCCFIFIQDKDESLRESVVFLSLNNANNFFPGHFMFPVTCLSSLSHKWYIGNVIPDA
jgi:hypothetical protein